MKHISKLVIASQNQHSKDLIVASPSGKPNEYAIKVKEVASVGNRFTFLNYRIHKPLYLDIHYKDGEVKRKELGKFHIDKAWEYIKRNIVKKAYQDSANFMGEGEESVTAHSNVGIGGRFKWEVKRSDVYHPATAAVVTKHWSVYDATLISPDSWVDSQLQKAYNSKRNESKEEQNETKTTPK
jgi:hypothetical protein